MDSIFESSEEIASITTKKRQLESDEVFIANASEKRTKVFPRSGKWTLEEESFAKQLIVNFETGLLKDCSDGCTLRAYLAKKLNCAPMRISKKFAGQCIGKVY